MALCPGLLTLEPLAPPLKATLPGFLLAFVVASGLGHGDLLRFVAAPWFSLGGGHDLLCQFERFHRLSTALAHLGLLQRGSGQVRPKRRGTLSPIVYGYG